jgi:hypothetical protein
VASVSPPVSALPHQLLETVQDALLLFSANYWGQRTFDADPGEQYTVLVYDDNVLRQLRRFYYP